MKKTTPAWEERAKGVKVLQLYGTDLNPHWPRIVILELSADRFREFEQNAPEFDKKYKLFYPESPISWMSTCAKPPHVKGVRPPKKSAAWTVVILKHSGTLAASSACYHES
ncbi:MAG TPA: hypothetical protein VG028_03160 [Terriglobia bacterium]|nr:hypothetical protein [Terriglobia bacterium]